MGREYRTIVAGVVDTAAGSWENLHGFTLEAEASLNSFARRVAASAAAGSETSWFSLPFEPGALTFAEPLMTGWLLHMLWLTCEWTRIWISAAFPILIFD